MHGRLDLVQKSLRDLHQRRICQEVLVKSALEPRQPQDSDSVPDQDRVLEENIQLLKQQLNCLRRRDAGLLSQLQELDQQIHQLRLDTDWSPDTPKTLDILDSPDTPDTPDSPDTQDTLDSPDTSDTPDSLDTLKTPDTNKTPDTPKTPDRPDAPDTPETPDTPDSPEADSRPSSGFYDLSDAASGSLSNSVFSLCSALDTEAPPTSTGAPPTVTEAPPTTTEFQESLCLENGCHKRNIPGKGKKDEADLKSQGCRKDESSTVDRDQRKSRTRIRVWTEASEDGSKREKTKHRRKKKQDEGDDEERASVRVTAGKTPSRCHRVKPKSKLGRAVMSHEPTFRRPIREDRSNRSANPFRNCKEQQEVAEEETGSEEEKTGRGKKRQSKAYVRIKASQNLKWRILRIRSSSFRLMTTV